MNSRVIVGLLGLCVLLMGILLLRLSAPPAAAQSSAPGPQAGRYSLVGTGGSEYFLDTKTGQMWVYVQDEVDKNGVLHTVRPHWAPMDSPVSAPAP